MTWKAAIVCTQCRLHAILQIDFQGNGHAICPNAVHPLHHFLFTETRASDQSIHYRFTCSLRGCPAALTVSYTQPVLDHEVIELLTNKDNLNKRYRAILSDDPTRKDVVVTTPQDALFRLKRYTDDSLSPAHEKRQFPAHNKKFLGAFGPDCHEFLTSLGFKYTVSSLHTSHFIRTAG